MDTERHILRWQFVLLLLLLLGTTMSMLPAAAALHHHRSQWVVLFGAGAACYGLLGNIRLVRLRRERLIRALLAFAIIAIAFGSVTQSRMADPLPFLLLVLGNAALWVAMSRNTGALPQERTGKALLVWDAGLLCLLVLGICAAPEYRPLFRGIRVALQLSQTCLAIAVAIVAALLLLQLTIMLSRRIPAALQAPRASFAMGMLLVLGIEIFSSLHGGLVRARFPLFEGIMLGFGFVGLAVAAQWEQVRRAHRAPSPEHDAGEFPAPLGLAIPGLLIVCLFGGGVLRVLFTPALLSNAHVTGYYLLVFTGVLILLLGRNLLAFGYLSAQLRLAHQRCVEAARHAATDSLTGLANHRSFMEQLHLEMRRALRYQRPLALVFCDLDNFKAINDTYGHSVGDQTLCAVAECLRRAVRETDRTGRYGGEEFVLLLPEATLAAACVIAERLRAQVAAIAIPIRSGAPVTLTISCGISAYPETCDSLQSILVSADNAMYVAKLHGRNRVEMAPLLPKTSPPPDIEGHGSMAK